MKKMRLPFVVSLIVVSSLSFWQASAEEEAVNENPLSYKVRVEPKEVPVGGKAKVIIDLDVAADHHAYKDMFKLQLMTDPPTDLAFEVGPIHKFEDTFSKKVREGVEGKGTLTATLPLPASYGTGKQVADFIFSYQACSSRYCLFPKEEKFQVPITVIAATASGSDDGSKSEFEKALAKGKIWAFFFAFVGGFLTSLTPCVFPMIPITISIIGARSAQNKRSRSFALSVSYVLGIGLTYALLGVIAASTGAFFGSALSNVWVVSAIAAMFIAMGLSMLGLFEMQVPAVIRNKLGNANTGAGLPGAFAAGLFAGVVASPCIGPVLVSILTYVAQTADMVFGFTLLFTFAMGMGILFIGLGTFSGLLTSMPKAGPWMETIKLTFGFTFIAMAFYYLRPVTPNNVFYMLIALAMFLSASYFGAFAPATSQKEQVRKGLCLATFFAGVFLMGTVIVGEFGYVPEGVVSRQPSSVVGEPKSASSLGWETYSAELVEKARKDKKPVIIDFHAEWCVACHELEQFTFSDPGVQSKSKDFVMLSIDATKPTDAVKALQKQYKVVGLPTIIFINANGEVESKQTVTGFVKADVFLKHMDETL